MSEKRFVCVDIGYGDDWYITDNGKRLSEMEIVDLLNASVEENERLIEKRGELETKNVILKKENEQLKKVCEMYSSATHSDREYIKELEEENEQLRKELNNCEKFRYAVFKRIGELNDE